MFDVELGALEQNRVYGRFQLVFEVSNGQIMLCFELNRRHVVVQDSFQRALPHWLFIYVAQNGIGRGTTPLAPAGRPTRAAVRPCAARCALHTGRRTFNFRGPRRNLLPL